MHRPLPVINRLQDLFQALPKRLDPDSLAYAIGYINHGELPLAFETICDCLCERDAPISRREYADILDLAKALHLDLSAGRYTYLVKLATVNSPATKRL